MHLILRQHSTLLILQSYTVYALHSVAYIECSFQNKYLGLAIHGSYKLTFIVLNHLYSSIHLLLCRIILNPKLSTTFYSDENVLI